MIISEMSKLGGNTWNMKFEHLPLVSQKFLLKKQENRHNLSRKRLDISKVVLLITITTHSTYNIKKG